MGTWDDGLLDNDTALDGLGDLTYGIGQDIVALGAESPGGDATERLCAAIGVLLQLSSYDFDPESPNGPGIAAALAAHATSIAELPDARRRVMQRVLDGEGMALAERPDEEAAAHAALFNKNAKASRFGRRETTLFSTDAARAYVQEVADRCVEAVDADFEDEGNWSDLCREAAGMGHLAVLSVLAPCAVSTEKIAAWREMATRGIAELRDRADDELEFQEGYYANLLGVLDVLAARFAGS